MLTPKILWIADQATDLIDQARFTLTAVASAVRGLEYLHNEDYDVVLVSFPLADWNSPADLLEEIQQIQPGTPVVIHTLEATNTEAARLSHLGAFHVVQHGDANSVLYLAANYKWARESSADCAAPEAWRRFLIGVSRSMQQVVDRIRLVAPRRSTVLITGETGTGKEVVARSIHAASPRAHLAMVSVNCSALPETLLEAELFGHTKGAFTGATNHRMGRFEQANHGTIFLDEIGDLPLSLQAKLLRVLQEREFQRLGSSETVKVDVRVIAATNTDLPVLIKAGKFREDLYYRLNVVPIELSPMREWPSDIPLLALHFIERICRDEGIAPKQISRETLDRLAAHDWPGNVRELENAVEKAIVLSGERQALFPGDFPIPARKHPVTFQPSSQTLIAVPDQGLDFERTVGTI